MKLIKVIEVILTNNIRFFHCLEVRINISDKIMIAIIQNIIKYLKKYFILLLS